jgi:XTP/dITP diphosphohydrolase
MSPVYLFLASSNSGKLREYRELARNSLVQLELIPRFNEFPVFEEPFQTFAENSAGKALHYSQFYPELVMADDSGLVVPALGGAPGVHSARYAGPCASNEARIAKVLREMQGKQGFERRAQFTCVVSLARKGRPIAIVSDFTEGEISLEPRGDKGFGYDPIFFSPALGTTFAEAASEGKNHYSHRGRAFRKVLELVGSLQDYGTFS